MKPTLANPPKRTSVFDSVRLAKKSICLPLPTVSCKAYADGFRFRAIPPGKTQGPWMGTDGKRHIVAFQSPTLGTANSEPSIGPIVISEIFAAPQREPTTATESDFEFVEIVNIHSSAIALCDLENRRCRMAIPRRHSF